MVLEIGRVCRKIAGKDAGKLCVIVKKISQEKDKSGNFVLITGPKLLTGVKRKRCNIMHLEPLEFLLDIKEDASDEEIIIEYEKKNLLKKFNLKKPSLAEIKAERDKTENKKGIEKDLSEVKKKKSKKQKQS